MLCVVRASAETSVNPPLLQKGGRMRWPGHVARMGRGEVLTGFGGEN